MGHIQGEKNLRVVVGWTPGARCRFTASRKEPEVSQSNTGQVQAAATLTQETKTFIRQVRTKTRRKYAPEDKIRIVLEGFRREVTVSDLCRREGIKPGVFYAWT